MLMLLIVSFGDIEVHFCIASLFLVEEDTYTLTLDGRAYPVYEGEQVWPWKTPVLRQRLLEVSIHTRSLVLPADCLFTRLNGKLGEHRLSSL